MRPLAALVLGGLLGLSPLGAPAAQRSVASWKAALRSAEVAVRLRAIDELARDKDPPSETVSLLTDSLRDSSPAVRAYAAWGLAQLGPQASSAVGALAGRLVDAEASVRLAAVQAIAGLRPDPAVALPLFVRACRDRDPAVRLRAMALLLAAGKPAVPLLSEMLKDEDQAAWAAVALGQFGPDAAPAAPDLAAAARSTRPEIRREAILALGQIGPKAVAAVPALTAALDDPAAQPAAAFALGRIAQPSEAAELKLRRAASGTDPLLQALSAWALARMHPEDKALGQSATVTLSRALASPEPYVRAAAARALADLPQGLDGALPTVVKTLHGADATVLSDALDALSALGPAAVPALTQALRFKDVRAEAAHVLGRMGPAARGAMGDLVKLLYDDAPRVRREAMYALGEMGPAAAKAVASLVAVARETDAPSRLTAIYALGKIGPSASAARPFLVEMLTGGDAERTLAASWALDRIDPPCRTVSPLAVPLLSKALEFPDPRTRLEAATSLRCLGPQARPALEALQKASEDENELVRNLATAALQAIGE